MKLFSLLVIAILLLQAFEEASSLGNDVADSPAPASMDQGNEEALYKKYHPRPHHKINCRNACWGRCRKASRKKLCLKACNICCAKCHCVPPAGTYGNKSFCPCYARLKTHGHRRMCP